MTLFTIGFTKKSAEEFFGLLQAGKVARVLDVRLNRSSQLSGFAKQRDLVYFLRSIGSIDHLVLENLAPTAELLDAYRSRTMTWDQYAGLYEELITERQVETSIPREILEGGCLLCSEHTAHKCHRRIAAEYLARHHDGLEIEHL
jgi:uncharacterized protein (DUF488 family)